MRPPADAPRRRRPPIPEAEAADRAVARAAIAAACEVTGCPLEDATNGCPFVPELLLVRTAAALALIDAGWSILWAAECCDVVSRNIDGTRHVEHRIRRHAPRVLAAAASAVARHADEAAAARRPPAIAAAIIADEVALTRGITTGARDVLDVARAHRRVGNSPRGSVLRRARRDVARKMRALGYTVREIAVGMGFAPSAVAVWLSDSC